MFGKLPDIWSLMGSAIIVGGAVYVALDKGRKPKVRAGNPSGKAEEGRSATRGVGQAEDWEADESVVSGK